MSEVNRCDNKSSATPCLRVPDPAVAIPFPMLRSLAVARPVFCPIKTGGATVMNGVTETEWQSEKPLLHGDVTSSIIDSFFEVHHELGFGFVESKAREPLDPDAPAQPFAGLAATDLEVGLVLHFGKKARFYRVLFENRFKQRNR
jgi:hypothetical protein